MMAPMVLADQPVGLAIMAKAPRAGAVKTRLCPPLRPPEAAELARCFLLDAVERAAGVIGVRPVLAYSPVEARSEFESVAPGFVLLPQQGDDLGVRQARLISEVLALGHQAALVIGTDSPTLPREWLDEAVSLVMAPDVDLVLGPTDDGGYYLLGLRAPCPALFEGMPWSTAAVLSRILDRAQRLGLRVACLPTWFDVDTKADLERLAAELAVTSGLLPRHTRDFLARRISPGQAGVLPADRERNAAHGGGVVASRGD
jgi:rSAM/selenodomain-associated transferase 1